MASSVMKLQVPVTCW